MLRKGWKRWLSTTGILIGIALLAAAGLGLSLRTSIGDWLFGVGLLYTLIGAVGLMRGTWGRPTLPGGEEGRDFADSVAELEREQVELTRKGAMSDVLDSRKAIFSPTSGSFGSAGVLTIALAAAWTNLLGI
ncbi:hypothetical protein MO973_20370 [Paenibacillus sp. TRM 82003]|nr:hypothetical protein [Paenibacillus sp. TRM 82003]